MDGMQNMHVVWNAGIGDVLEIIRARVLEMSGSDQWQWKGAGLKMRYVHCTTVTETASLRLGSGAMCVHTSTHMNT